MAKKRRRAARRSPAPAPAPRRRRSYSRAAPRRRRRATGGSGSTRLKELLAAAAVGFLANRVVAPKLAEIARKKPDSNLPKYGVGPYLLAGGYALQRLAPAGLMRTVGDTAMVSGALLLGTRFGRSSDASEAAASSPWLLGPQTFDKKTLPSPESSVQGDDDIGNELSPSELRALQSAMAIAGDEDIGDDDIGDDVAEYLAAIAGDDDIGDDDIGDDEDIGDDDIGDDDIGDDD